MVKLKSDFKKNTLPGALLLLPAILILLIFVAYPLIRGIYLSFTDLYLLEPESGNFNGLQNFIKFFTVGNWLLYLKNTIIWTLGSVIGAVVLGVILAVQLNKRNLMFRGIYRSLALIPWIMPIIAGVVVWRWIYDGQWGILNYILKQLHIIQEYKVWLGDKDIIWFSLIIFMIWKVFPFVYVMVLSGLQGIPVEINEAAKIDGATNVGIFWKITFPLILPILTVVTLLLTIWTANEFTAIWAMTQGGPANASMTLPPLVYMTTFQYYHVGYGASIGVFLMLIMSLLVVLYVRKIRV